MPQQRAASQILLLLLVCLAATFNCEDSFIKSEQTPTVAILNNASYASIDSKYGKTELQRVKNRLDELKQTYPQTSDALKGISVVEANQNYSIFANGETKQLYFTLRGTSLQKGSDLVNDSQLGINLDPSRLAEINRVMNDKVVTYKNSGYSVNVSGHSLGGTLALMTCADNSWISHCEVHNPYLDNSIIKKLNTKIDSENNADRFLIQITNGDLVSSFFPTTKVNVKYSIFDQLENVRGLIDHSDLTLFAKVYLDNNNIVVFNQVFYSIEIIKNYIVGLKEKFEEIFKLLNSCSNSSYIFSLETLRCVVCPAGQSCELTIFGPEKCAPGTFASYGKCWWCKKGNYQDQAGSTGCKTCPEGYYCPDVAKEPIPAPPGHYQQFINNDKYYACPNGTYNTEQGQIRCKNCPEGYYCPDPAKEPIPAPPGHYQKYINNDKYYACEKGTYNTEYGKTGCKSCPVGYYCPDATKEPIPAPPGHYQQYVENDQYYACQKGTYNTEYGKARCKSCPVGYYCPDATKEPIPAPPGHYQQYVENDQYYACEKGTYNTEYGKARCNSCPVGYYCPAIDKEPIPCPLGFCCPYRDSANYQYCSKRSRLLQIFGRNVI